MEQQNFSPPSSLQQPSPKGIKSFLPIILLILVAALVGVLVWQKNNANQIADALQQQIILLQNQINNRIIATTSNETAGWKTYTNARYGYSIKYPSDWWYKDYSDSANDLILSEVFFSDSYKQLSEKYELNTISIVVRSYEIKINDRGFHEITSPILTVFVDGVESTKVSGTVMWDKEGLVPVVEVLIPKNNKFYTVSAWGTNNLAVFNEILGTFKFTK